MIITRELPRDRWRRVLDDLSRLHGGATVQLQVLDEEHGVHAYGGTLRLVGLASDGLAGREAISATLEAGAGVHLTHTIDNPRTVRIELLWESRTANIQITDADGRPTLICLGPPLLADGVERGLVDGINESGADSYPRRENLAESAGSSALVPFRPQS